MAMKITLSKSQWRLIGKQAGWMKVSANRPGNELQEKPIEEITKKLMENVSLAPNLRAWLALPKNKNTMGLIESMKQNIKNSIPLKIFSINVGNPATQEDKNKFLAYRELASLMGYTMGEGKVNQHSGTVTAPIQ